MLSLEQRNKLKRHNAATHGDLTELKDDDAIRNELLKRKCLAEDRKKQREKVLCIAHEVGAPASCYKEYFPNTSISTNLEEELLRYNDIYTGKMEQGKQIYEILCKGKIMEDSLPKKYKEALDIFRNSRRSIDVNAVELRAWQHELMEKIKVPTERQVIWVKGVKGNVGKTFFQKYMQSLFGYSRVVQLDLKSKTANILHALRKFPLSTADIFFLNEARAINYETCCYDVLEMIKDGSATSSKFDSEVIQFKTPNIVVVFSNSDPNIKQLSKDRWAVYYISKDGLSSQEERLWKARNIKRSCNMNLIENFE